MFQSRLCCFILHFNYTFISDLYSFFIVRIGLSVLKFSCVDWQAVAEKPVSSILFPAKEDQPIEN